MDLAYFKNKEYKIPRNAPQTREHIYLEIIKKGYAKYLDIISSCDNFIMYHQFYKLVEIIDGVNRTSNSNKTIAKRIIAELHDLGFIDSEHINRNKFIYLRRPGIAIAEGDYNSHSRVNLSKDLKNDKFKVSILKVEYFLQCREVLHGSNMIEQLKDITSNILQLILKNNNKYGYDVSTIKEILKMKDYLDIIRYLDEKPEYMNKLDMVRSLWVDIGSNYRKLLLQRQTVLAKAEYLKYYINHNGQIILHYIPKIVIFDVSHDNDYYRDKSVKLFNAFYRINGNELKDVQKTYTLSNKTNMGYLGTHHIGYTILLIGADKEVLREKKATLDEDFNKSINSPLMGPIDIIDLNIGDYMYHASRKGNTFSKKHNERIDRLILKKLSKIDLVKGEGKNNIPIKNGSTKETKSSKSAGKNILDLLK